MISLGALSQFDWFDSSYFVLIGSLYGHVTNQKTNQHRDNDKPFRQPVRFKQDNKIGYSLVGQSPYN